MVTTRRSNLTTKIETLFVDDVKITISHKNTKNSNIRLAKDGSIKVTFSNYAPIDFNQRFLNSKLPYFITKSKQLQKPGQEFLISLDKANEIWFHGKKVPVIIEPSKKNYVGFGAEFITVYTKDFDVEKINKLFANSLKKHTIEHFTKLFNKNFQIFNEQFYNKFRIPTLKIKALKATWGICKPRSNEVSLALRLVMFDDEIIDYIIFHELTHLVHPNHQAPFYKTLDHFVNNRTLLDLKMKDFIKGK